MARSKSESGAADVLFLLGLGLLGWKVLQTLGNNRQIPKNMKPPWTEENWPIPERHVEPIRSPIPGELPPFEDVTSTIIYN